MSIVEQDYFIGAPLGKLVYDRTYSRTMEDGAKECWPDTVKRVINGNISFVDPAFIEPGEKELLHDLLLKRVLIPAGRHLWVTGVEGRAFTQNCHVAGFETGLSDHAAFVKDELMKGGGVGANYSSRYLKNCTPLAHKVDVTFICDNTHADYDSLQPYLRPVPEDWTRYVRISDDREGWVDALRILIETSQTRGGSLVFSVSDIRCAGSPIKGFGGTASGPLALILMLNKVKMLTAIGEIAPPIAMLIDHYIAECVIAGNVRRSARMSIMHWKDPYIEWFLTCKQNDPNAHWSTNISVEIDDEFLSQLNIPGSDAEYIYEQVIKGMLENGEPGFYNSSLASVGETTHLGATNPCLTGDTVISTVDGPRTFESLAETGQDVLIYAWHPETKKPVIRMMRRPHKTATDVRILEVEFDSGLKVRCTPDHGFYSFRGKKVKAKDLKVGKSVRAWSMSAHRDGHLRVHAWDSTANSACHQWVSRMVYENVYGEIPEGFVVHHKDENKKNNHISNLETVTITEHNQEHYQDRLDNGFHWTSRQENKFYGNQYTENHKVVGIREAGTADVYNGCVDDAHTYIILDPEAVAGIASGIVSANCGEMPLESWESCNLGHVNLAFGNYGDHLAAFRLMTRFLIRATHCDISDPKQQEVVDRNRRIGVGFFGLQEWLAKHNIPMSQFNQGNTLRDSLMVWANIVRREADSYADALGIPRPIKTTTLAPTGTIAKLAGTSESLQAIYAKYYIRNVRYSANDPEVKLLRERGIPLEDCIYSVNTVVASFACRDTMLDRVPEYLIEEQNEIPLEATLGLQALIQKYYCDNAISCTINLPNASAETRLKLQKNLRKFLPVLKGTTVFVEASRPQSPIIKITQAEYERLHFGTGDDINAGESEQLLEECLGGSCPIR